MLSPHHHPSSASHPQVRNDAASDGLDLARRRIKKLEDAREAAEAKLELSQVNPYRRGVTIRATASRGEFRASWSVVDPSGAMGDVMGHHHHN